MRFAGSRSWRFEHDNLDILQVALFVRDSAQLPVAEETDVPPPLTGEIPDGLAVLSPPDQAAAAGQWLQWWRQMLGQAMREVRIRQAEDPLDDALERIRTRVLGRTEICDMPRFESLTGSPELQTAALAAFGGYQTWSAAAGPASREPRLFEWQLVRDAVHRAAASLGVPVNEMDGVAHVVPVRGLWSCIAGPGCGVCSTQVGRDQEAGSAFLYELFVSGKPDQLMPGRAGGLS